VRSLRDMTEPELRNYFNHLAQAVEDILPAGPSKKGRALFALLVFDDPGLAQYVSNAERKDVIKAMRECADRLEAKEDIPR
jgi:hypothetical protein